MGVYFPWHTDQAEKAKECFRLNWYVLRMISEEYNTQLSAYSQQNVGKKKSTTCSIMLCLGRYHTLKHKSSKSRFGGCQIQTRNDP